MKVFGLNGSNGSFWTKSCAPPPSYMVRTTKNYHLCSIEIEVCFLLFFLICVFLLTLEITWELRSFRDNMTPFCGKDNWNAYNSSKYRVFIKYCVFSLKCFFLNSASSAAALVFYLPGVCTHTDPEGKQSLEYFKIFGKNTIFNEHPLDR